MYRSFELGPLKLPYYASPSSQLIVVGLVAFLTAGMFNALSGLGGGGQVDPIINDKANTALYSTFSVVGFFAGTFVNRLGIRSTLSFGGFGYAIFVASFLCYNHTANGGFVIFAGALLGCCAGLLWAAQGAIMMSYPQEKDKGKYISWFWMIFNLGAVIGSLIPLGENINNTGGTVTDGTYIGFMILNLIGAGLALCLVDANHIIRRDGSRVILMKHPTWQSEIFGLWEVIRSDPYIILLFPMFFSANFFYNYHFTAINLSRFTIRARSLNSLLYWTSQIIGAYVFGYTLDFPRVSRKARARGSLVVLFSLTVAIWGGGYAFQKDYSRASVLAGGEAAKLDWTSEGYVGPMFLYMFYGFYDSAWQVCVYWYMGSLTNNSRKLANFTGFYKGNFPHCRGKGDNANTS
jgi:MFS family permease